VTYLNRMHQKVRTTLRLPVEFVLHSLRHTMLSRLGEAGVDAFTIMRIAGHSSVTVSQRYVHPSNEAMERAIEKLDVQNVSVRIKVGTSIGTMAESEQSAESLRHVD
jgi:integrase